MPFKLAYLRLTFFYVLIAMTISIVFSAAIYNISSREIGQGLGRQNRLMRELSEVFGQNIDDFETLREQQILESNRHLKLNLIYYNLWIFVLATIASYFLARKTLQPIEEAFETQKRFTADASHELRTPLAALKSEIEVNLRDKKLSLTSAKKLLKSNLEEIDKLETLSSALLKLTRYQEQEKIKFKKISLEDVLVEAYEKVESKARQKSIQFKNKLKDVKVSGDRVGLVELFTILLDNAIKYSSKNKKIFITVTNGKKHTVVKIKDQGIGIKKSDLPYIFDRFYRADTSRSKEKIQGYGLGLSIAKQIIKLHHAKISVKSKPGQGSEFKVRF